MTLVQTEKGLIPRDQLETADMVTENENVRVTVTVWTYRGERVRTDAFVNALRGLEVGSNGG